MSNYESIQHDRDFWVLTPLVMGGFIQFKSAFAASGVDAYFSVFCRKDTKRLGARYYSRGIDKHGNVSNFVESEQILMIRGPGRAGLSLTPGSSAPVRIFDYLQIRGSIPVFWTQAPTLVFKPPCRISPGDEKHQSAFDLHAEHLLDTYKQTSMVNLVDKQGYQKRLGLKFQDVVQNSRYSGQIDYTWFDYHAQCKGMKVENCAKLMDGLRDTIDRFGWTEAVFEEGSSRLTKRPVPTGQGPAGRDSNQLHRLPRPEQRGAVHARQK